MLPTLSGGKLCVNISDVYNVKWSTDRGWSKICDDERVS